MYDVKIRAVLNGYIVEVGCQTVVYSSTDLLCDELKRYLTNPQNTIKDYQENSMNARILGPTPPTSPDEPCGTTCASQKAPPAPPPHTRDEPSARVLEGRPRQFGAEPNPLGSRNR